MALLAASATYIVFDVSMASALGWLKAAATPTPFTRAAMPLPAKVVTEPFASSLRMRWFILSAMKTLPTESTTTASGVENMSPPPFE